MPIVEVMVKKWVAATNAPMLYELTLNGKSGLRLDEKSIEELLKRATNEQLAKFIDLF